MSPFKREFVEIVNKIIGRTKHFKSAGQLKQLLVEDNFQKCPAKGVHELALSKLQLLSGCNNRYFN